VWAGAVGHDDPDRGHPIKVPSLCSRHPARVGAAIRPRHPERVGVGTRHHPPSNRGRDHLACDSRAAAKREDQALYVGVVPSSCTAKRPRPGVPRCGEPGHGRRSHLVSPTTMQRHVPSMPVSSCASCSPFLSLSTSRGMRDSSSRPGRLGKSLCSRHPVTVLLAHAGEPTAMRPESASMRPDVAGTAVL
jgi:hypothetical protein